MSHLLLGLLSTTMPKAPADSVRTRRARSSTGRAVLRLAGVPVRDTRSDRLARFLSQRLRQGRKIAVGFVNQNFVVTCRDIDPEPCGRDNLILVNDGIGMQLAALVRFGRAFRENLNGTDFLPRFLCGLEQPVTVYLVGGEPTVVAQAAAVIATLPRCRVVGHCDGFSLWDREDAVLREITAAAPDVLLVGLGNPVQERWILRNWDRLDATLVFGVGALFEWWSGHRRRAPRAVRRMRLEWLYRLALEPRRLCHRYTIGILRFFALVLLRPAAALRSGMTP